jgi:hypothetical protein
MKPHPLFALLLSLAAGTVSSLAADFYSWALRPPMGWNSWDNFATAITETQTLQQAEYMAAHLKSFGWEYIVVDIQWYEPGAVSHAYRKNPVLVMDEFGRLLPAPNRFPSSSRSAGFKPLSDTMHRLGLKLGLHLMRGIPRQAVEKNLPIKGTQFCAADVADKTSTCAWNGDMYGVDMNKPGAQEYYNSVFELFASWGVDYVKVDDIARPYHDREIEAIRTAIDRTGRPIVLSLSPGETRLSAADHVKAHANLWRISDDFWDAWPLLHEQFGRLDKWTPHRGPGAWPDADMLPLGIIDMGKRPTHFTHDEQFTLMTLWSIARSPLMHGGDLTRTDPFTLSLLTNDEVLAVNQAGINNRRLFDHDDLIAWVADVPGCADRYLALFNARDQIPLAPDQAAYRSEIMSPSGRTSTGPVEIDVTGAVKLVLLIDDAGDGIASDHGVWVEPRLVDVSGRETKLSTQPWTSACGGWGQVSAIEEGGKGGPTIKGQRVPYGISANAISIVQYDLPKGCQKFRFGAGLDDGTLSAKEGGTIRFLVFVAKPGGNLDLTGLPVSVDLKSLGFPSGAKVRDLWARKDLGEKQGLFAPLIPWHGAALFRLSPK